MMDLYITLRPRIMRLLWQEKTSGKNQITEYRSFSIIYQTEPNLILGKNKGCPLVGQLFPFLLYFYVKIFQKLFFKFFFQILNFFEKIVT